MSEPTRPQNPFRTVTFGGYHREDVDGYLDMVAVARQRQEDELTAARSQLGELTAKLEAQEQGQALAVNQSERDASDLRIRMTALRDELERTKVELAKTTERADSAIAERDNFQRIAEKLSAEELQTRELLRAASRTAEEMKVEAKREALETAQRAEMNARRIEDDARKRVEDLRKEYERARREYDEFLKAARDVADGLVRRIDDARAKWPS